MLRASLTTPNGPLLLAGLTEGNITRLKAGMLIKAPFSSFGVESPGSLAIIYGTTEADLERTLREHGLIMGATRATVDPRVDQAGEIAARHAHVLICTVGLPRSGKSTWARGQAYPIVNPDAIRLAMHGQRFSAQAEPFVWLHAKLMVRSLFGAGHKYVILDATNVSRKRRDEWRSESEWGLFFKHIITDPETCLQRAIAANDGAMMDVINRMEREFEPLGADEKVWP